MTTIVPPGGFAGFSQMAPASRVALFPRSNGGGVATRRRKKARKSTAKRTKKRATKTKGRKMKFGSPAWQKKYKVGKYRK